MENKYKFRMRYEECKHCTNFGNCNEYYEPCIECDDKRFFHPKQEKIEEYANMLLQKIVFKLVYNDQSVEEDLKNIDKNIKKEFVCKMKTLINKLE